MLAQEQGGYWPAAEPRGSESPSPSPSLSDLPVAPADPQVFEGWDSPSRPSPPPDLFDFFFGDPSAATSDMCAAADIFCRGKLLPLDAAPPPPSPERSVTHNPRSRLPCDQRRADSLDRPRRDWSGRIAAVNKKLRRASTVSDTTATRTRPRWWAFVFGSVRVPDGMELRDIRSRQRRRRATLVADDSPGLGSQWGRGPWKLLRSLSCGSTTTMESPLPLDQRPLSFSRSSR